MHPKCPLKHRPALHHILPTAYILRKAVTFLADMEGGQEWVGANPL